MSCKNMENKVDQSGVLRKRGRPAGKNRIPLSQNERRARNAQYERERRIEMNDALADLAAAAGCKASISNADLLATVITQLQQASRVKHSSDLDSLRRCNKNLLAQIETLEARLFESDGGCSVPVKQEEVANMSRPVKRKREDYENYAPVKCTPVLESSHPEYKCKPPVDSPEQKYFPEPSLPVYLPEQPLLKEDDYSLESILQQHFTPEPKYSPEPIKQDNHNLTPAPKYSPVQEFEPVEPHFPVHAATPHHCLPVPRVSPQVDSLPGHQSTEHDDVDYSSYNFAGPQLPTPEYQISEPSEFIVPEQQYTHGYSQYQPSLQCVSGPSSPEDQYSPSPFMPMVPEMHYPAINQQPAFAVPAQPNVVGSVGILPMPRASILPDINEVEHDPSQVHFLSTEDLISAYF